MTEEAQIIRLPRTEFAEAVSVDEETATITVDPSGGVVAITVDFLSNEGIATVTLSPSDRNKEPFTATLNLSNMDKDQPIKLVTEGVSIELIPPTQKQGTNLRVVTNEHMLKVGDTLGADIKLPQTLQHLDGWIVYNITEEGIPQALEPAEISEKTAVNSKEAEEHISVLKKQGHKNVHLWSEDDRKKILQNIIEGGHNDKVQLEADNPDARYWGEEEHVEGYAYTFGLCASNTTYETGELRGQKVFAQKFYGKDSNEHYVRATQNLPELAILLC